MIKTQFDLMKLIVLMPPEHLSLTATEKNVLIHVIGYMNNKFECFPSLKKLSKTSGLGLSTVKRSIKVLESKKVLNKYQKFTANGYANNHYKFNTALLKKDSGTQEAKSHPATKFQAQDGKYYSCPAEFYKTQSNQVKGLLHA